LNYPEFFWPEGWYFSPSVFFHNHIPAAANAKYTKNHHPAYLWNIGHFTLAAAARAPPMAETAGPDIRELLFVSAIPNFFPVCN
jgi:hypothetical protein